MRVERCLDMFAVLKLSCDSDQYENQEIHLDEQKPQVLLHTIYAFHYNKAFLRVIPIQALETTKM